LNLGGAERRGRSDREIEVRVAGPRVVTETMERTTLGGGERVTKKGFLHSEVLKKSEERENRE